ncbi:ATP-binding protein [Nocardioides pocheonensis]|uniref:LuxR family transcriptional regulator n=1 Tax=Nocardioides pocheonensis TaxID=661485 RepID=A0A3N0GQV0_9ACTN|nr:LuxR C-terminal-related transcriptional regulator [Nocardioides pocheonensis]RNM14771.1 LuxR family transcriptional regulator [Nocardioides pocheonensis]
MRRSAPVSGSGLPPALTSFVGRRRELSEARRLLTVSRLVTLTGPGGVGKTRLALEAAASVRKDFRDGVVVVELEQVTDAALVPSTVAVALGLRESAGRAPMEMLVDYLRERRLLLVLDNSEHVIDEIAALTDQLLQGCPQLRVLATSRERLDVPGEAFLPVPTLSLPDADEPIEPDDLLEYGAVELFRDRAAAALPGWELTETNRADVGEICRRLDGLPLAIELAAARMRALSERDMLDRLSDHLHLLSASPRTRAPGRQRTLRSCIEWSHGLCSTEEQLLWARVSVFAGGFELDLAEEVAAGEGLPAARVLEALTSLVDKSIVIAERIDGVVRFRLLETIREFGRDQLSASGEVGRLRRSHRDAYVRLVERADADWVSPRQVGWFARLDREHANFQSALDFSLNEPGETEGALRILAALYHFYWWGRGWAREGRHWLARALEEPGPPTVVRARALLTDASLSFADGDYETGRARLDAARAIEAAWDDPGTAAFGAFTEGSAALFAGELATTKAVLEEGLTLDLPDRDLKFRLDMLLSYGSALALLGDVERATWCHEEFLRITEPAGECFHRSYALWTLGLFVLQQGDQERAAELLRQSIALRRGIRDLTGLGWSEETLAWTEGGVGDHERAATLLGIADLLWEIMGRPLVTYQHLYPLHEGCERAAREALGDDRFTACFERGRALGIDGGISFALRESTSAARPASSDGTDHADHGLTAREGEIAELIAEGLTNREIAARLNIAVRTAEAHSQNILTKLGFRSRTQVATWVAQGRPPVA